MRTICLCLSVLLLCSAQMANEAVIESFDSYAGWLVFTDQALGGKSSAEMKYKKGVSEFRGNLSKTNNAGVAQVISPKLKHDLSQHQGFELRLKGDGKAYHFSLQEEAFCKNGKHLEYTFTTKKDEWQILHIPFDEFETAYFGVPVLRNAPKLNEIDHVSFINTDEEGRFHLEIDYVVAY